MNLRNETEWHWWYNHTTIHSIRIPDSDLSDDDMEGTASIPITVKFTHKKSDKTKISQEQSHQQHLMRAAEEAWCETTFYNSTSSTAMVSRRIPNIILWSHGYWISNVHFRKKWKDSRRRFHEIELRWCLWQRNNIWTSWYQKTQMISLIPIRNE